jgi:hypothetical protein
MIDMKIGEAHALAIQRGRFPGRPTRQAALESARCSFRFPYSTWE